MALLPALCSLTACNPYAPPLHRGEALAAAGFTAHRADTAAREQMMALLPPETLTYRPAALGRVMLYADPLACGCVYFGDDAALRAYTRSQPLSPAAEKAMLADNRQHPGWDWSVWSPSADPAAVAHLAPGYQREPGWQ